jgi:hypothetical protein
MVCAACRGLVTRTEFFPGFAFLWLVLGLFIQQQELANNTQELRRTSEQSAIQTQAIAATEMNARQGRPFSKLPRVSSSSWVVSLGCCMRLALVRLAAAG